MKSTFVVAVVSAIVTGYVLSSASPCAGQAAKPSRVSVKLVTDEADSVLAVLGKRKAGQTITDTDWARIFQSEGYVRLKQRELSLKRPFADTDFKTFVLSEELGTRTEALEQALDNWKRADTSRAANLALAYLPKEARITAKIYPVIKPRENSFVFDVRNDPAIFLFLDPTVTRAKFENTLAHELHHIGYGTACPSAQTTKEIAKLSADAQTTLNWIGAFGEGFAMLAAAGGPDVHPHAVSNPEERARWDGDVANFNRDLKEVEKFFLDVLHNRLTADEVQTKAFSFFGIQGPWYTVGWKMAVTIEKMYGRKTLIKCFCDQRKLLITYNRAAVRHNRRSHDNLALWSDAVIAGITNRH